MEFGKFNRGDRDRRNRGRDQDQGGRERSFGGNRERGGGGRFNDREQEESVYSQKVRAGKRRTYFMDVRQTRGNDYFITITESTRRDDGYGYKRHKIFLYKEDFNRFVATLNDVVQHVKTELMPDFDYEEFDRRQEEWEAQQKLRDEEEDEEVTNKSREAEQSDEDAEWPAPPSFEDGDTSDMDEKED